MKDEKETLKDLHHVVPAVSKAYIYIATGWDVWDEEGKTVVEKEWCDGIFDVLAYGHLSGGWGAYLIDTPQEGPQWISACHEASVFMRVYVEDTPPLLGRLDGTFAFPEECPIKGEYQKSISPLDPEHSDGIQFIWANP